MFLLFQKLTLSTTVNKATETKYLKQFKMGLI